MRLTSTFFRKNRVKIILLGLILGNIAFYQLTSSVFSKNKEAELQEDKRMNKTSYFHGGVYIIHLGNAVVDYFRLFGEGEQR